MQLYKWKVNKQTSKKWSCWKLKYWWIFTTFCYFLEDLQTVVHCSTLVCHCTTRPWLPSPPCTWSTNATRVKNNLIKVKSNLKCVVGISKLNVSWWISLKIWQEMCIKDRNIFAKVWSCKKVSSSVAACFSSWPDSPPVWLGRISCS